MNLTPTEREILVHLLVHGGNSAVNIADDIDRHAVSVRRSGKDLAEKGLVRHKGNNVFGLTSEGLVIARDIQSEQ
jgi:predicted transcriptional regulator